MTKEGRKISHTDDNPLDNLFISLSDKLCPYFKKYNFTPNILTFIGLIFGLISCYTFYFDKIFISVILFYIYYFFDCLDGHYARKYKMETQFGDYFDHFRDILITFSIIVLIVYKSKNKYLIGSILIIFYILFCIHMGCQEEHSQHVENNKFLQKLRGLCLDKSYIKYTRFFGCGTFIFIMSFLMIFRL